MMVSQALLPLMYTLGGVVLCLIVQAFWSIYLISADGGRLTRIRKGVADSKKLGDPCLSGTHGCNEECKMVLCVRMDLQMGKGKIGAQCAHAAMGAFCRAAEHPNQALSSWLGNGQPKVVLKVQDEFEAKNIYSAARRNKINSYIVYDAGRTQIPEGSLTVVAIGPAPRSAIDGITGHLKLL